MVQEVTVVRNNQLCTLERSHKVFKPFSGLYVQVFGRLVKEDDVDTVETDKLPCKSEFSLLSTGQLVHGHIHGMLVKTQPFKNSFCNSCNVASTTGRQRLLKLSIMFHHRFPIAFVKRWVNHLCFNSSDFIFQFLELAAFSAKFLFDG